ncbi:MAG: ATP-binding cassette domain-containing protein [Candidatus Thermoplasmatota archaeon]|nr:ATP-binding cassette domain-containing protein [Candidatus Thermoplasmatota archaeon]
MITESITQTKTNAIIKINGLTKRYGDLLAVDNLSFEVNEGEIFGLVGLNGAGKTSTVMMLSTLRKPTEGTATVNGYDILKNPTEVRRSIGIVFEEQAVDTYLTGRQNLEYAARIYGLPPEARKKKVDEILETVGLSAQADKSVGDYSGGMLRRLEIGRSMLIDPKILFLDEPTIGVDVQTRRYLWDYLKKVNRENHTTIFLSTSYLEEAEYLCNRVAIMHKGKIMAIGKPEELEDAMGKTVLEIKLSHGTAGELLKVFDSQKIPVSIDGTDGTLKLAVGEHISVVDVMREAKRAGLSIASISAHRPTLNDVLLSYAGKESLDNVKNYRRQRKEGGKPAIEVKGLTKEFGNFTAVDHISFDVKEKEIFGFLGPNGAGKTTTTKMLTTLLKPTEGTAVINGHDVVKEASEVRKSTGIVFQDRSTDRYLTGYQNLDLHGRMYSMPKEERERKIKEVIELMELQGKEHTILDRVPENVRRRFEVGRGFMAFPKVVFLDEPTIGFDIGARADLWEQIIRAKERENVTVILTTHYIDEADYLCDRVAIIDKAKIVAIGTPEELKAQVGEDLIAVEVEKDGELFAEAAKELSWVRNVEERGNSLVLSVEKGEGRVESIIDLADEKGFHIMSIEERLPTLEDVFIHFTGRSIREAEGEVKQNNRRRRQ